MHFYFGPRCFVIVAEGHGRTVCVPIYTYEHRGCNKKGVKPEEHGIIYSAHHKPFMLSNEPPLGFDPVPVIMRESEWLAKESRVLYAKLENAEHNAPVRFIGTVDRDSFWIVENAVDAWWDENTKLSDRIRHIAEDRRTEEFHQRSPRP